MQPRTPAVVVSVILATFIGVDHNHVNHAMLSVLLVSKERDSTVIVVNPTTSCNLHPTHAIHSVQQDGANTAILVA